MPDNIVDTLLSIGGKILIAAVILLVTWLVATGVKWGIGKLVDRIKFLQKAGADGSSVGDSVGKVAVLVIWLFGLIAVLQVFSLTQVISPIQTMLQNVMAFLPNLIGAVVVFVIGALLARVVRQLIETGLRALPLDKLINKAGAAADAHVPGGAPASSPASGPPPMGQQGQPPMGQPGQPPMGQPGQPPMGQPGQPPMGQPGQPPMGQPPQGAPQQTVAQGTTAKIAHLVALIVYALIIIVVAIAALQILGISAISDPAEQMLAAIFDSIPRILAAVLLLGLGVLIARFVGDLVKQLLEGIGADKAIASAGVLPETTKPSAIITRVVQVAIVLFFAVMAAQALAFPQITSILEQVLTLGGQVLFGAVIIAAGFFLGGLIARLMNAGVATTVIKYVTIVLFSAMGLKAMGIADSIIELGFGAVVVGGALAAALAFGLGGRDAAARTLQKIEVKAEEASEEAAAAEAAQPAAPATPSAGSGPDASGPESSGPAGPADPAGPTGQG